MDVNAILESIKKGQPNNDNNNNNNNNNEAMSQIKTLMNSNKNLLKGIQGALGTTELDKATNEYRKQKKQYSTKKEDYLSAEKRYYLASGGTNPGYKDILTSRYDKSADNIVSIASEKTDKSFNDIMVLVSDYEATETYYLKMDDLFKIKTEENEKLKAQLERDITLTQTNNRKVIYEENSKTNLSDNRKMVLYLYYLVLALYMIFGSFIKQKDYTNLFIWLLLIIYISLPFYVDYMMARVLKFYRYTIYVFTNKLPKNVYTNL